MNHANKVGSTPLLAAVHMENEPMVAYLLEAGARVGDANKGGTGPLQLAQARVGPMVRAAAAGRLLVLN